MKRIQKIILASFIALLGLVATPVVTSVSAINVFEKACEGSSGTVCDATKKDEVAPIIKNVINTLLLVLGMIAVIMIVIGGVRYATSGGDSSQTKAAKDTILYAVVGMVVALLAYAIVNFVLGNFK